MSREDYIEYFTHMQTEDKKCMFGGMAWDDIGWHIYGATEKDKLFTRNELVSCFIRTLEGEVDITNIKFFLQKLLDIFMKLIGGMTYEHKKRIYELSMGDC